MGTPAGSSALTASLESRARREPSTDRSRVRPRGGWWRWPLVELIALAACAPFLVFPQRFGTPLAIAATLTLLVLRVARRLRVGQIARSPLDVPLAIILLMALVGTAISIDWTLTRPKLFGLIFGVATIL